MNPSVMFFTQETAYACKGIGKTFILFCNSSIVLDSLYKHVCQPRLTCLTPFTVFIFFTNNSNLEVSSTITVIMPENNPSCELMLIERKVMLFSLLIMEVILVTIPMSSWPTMRRVIGYCLP